MFRKCLDFLTSNLILRAMAFLYFISFILVLFKGILQDGTTFQPLRDDSFPFLFIPPKNSLKPISLQSPSCLIGPPQPYDSQRFLSFL